MSRWAAAPALLAALLFLSASYSIDAEKTPLEAGIRARDLMESHTVGTLITTMGAGQWADFPFGSMDYFAPDAEGSPILLLSHLQLNSRNVAADARAALHVREVHPTQTPLGADPLSNAPRGHPYSPFQHQQHFVDSHSVHTQSPMSSARLTLLGTVEALTDSDEIEDARARFVAAHPDAAGWAPGAPGGGGFHDFKWHKLRPTGLYWIGGFGGLHYIGWVDIALYRNASSTLIDDAN